MNKSKALNFNEGKERWSLLLKDFAEELKEILKVRECGVQKYARDNYIMSLGTESETEFRNDNFDSMFRHLISATSGELKDDESKCYHMAHIACRALFELAYIKGNKQD